MKKPDQDSAAIRRIHNQLDQDVAGLSSDVTDALALARQKAVAAAKQKQAKQKSKGAGVYEFPRRPLMALAASVTLAVPLLWWLAPQDGNVSDQMVDLSIEGNDQEGLLDIAKPVTTQDKVMTDAEILLQLATLNEEDMAIVNDLEFVAWLSEQPLEEAQRS